MERKLIFDKKYHLFVSKKLEKQRLEDSKDMPHSQRPFTDCDLCFTVLERLVIPNGKVSCVMSNDATALKAVREKYGFNVVYISWLEGWIAVLDNGKVVSSDGA